MCKGAESTHRHWCRVGSGQSKEGGSIVKQTATIQQELESLSIKKRGKGVHPHGRAAATQLFLRKYTHKRPYSKSLFFFIRWVEFRKSRDMFFFFFFFFSYFCFFFFAILKDRIEEEEDGTRMKEGGKYECIIMLYRKGKAIHIGEKETTTTCTRWDWCSSSSSTTTKQQNNIKAVSSQQQQHKYMKWEVKRDSSIDTMHPPRCCPVLYSAVRLLLPPP